MTDEQRQLYRHYLDSTEVKEMLGSHSRSRFCIPSMRPTDPKKVHEMNFERQWKERESKRGAPPTRFCSRTGDSTGSMIFRCLTNLRKLCNHPDLYEKAIQKQEQSNADPTVEQRENAEKGGGEWRRSGKMILLDALLAIWFKQGHRVLLFSQGRQVLFD